MSTTISLNARFQVRYPHYGNIAEQLIENAGTRFEGNVGRISVQPLDWSAEEKLATVDPPYDYVLAADCVYHEHHVDDLLDTILRLTDAKSTGPSHAFPCLESKGIFDGSPDRQ